MKVELRKVLGATILGIALGIGSAAFAQEQQPPEQPPVDDVTPEQPAPDQEQPDEVSALVPQYWIANASLHIANAHNVTRILLVEQELAVQQSEILSEQAQILNASINRAIESLQALEENALATKPSAVPAIRGLLAQLTVAQVQASVIANAAADGQLGPIFEVTLRSLQQHLTNAQDGMVAVAQEYGARDLVLSGGATPRPRR